VSRKSARPLLKRAPGRRFEEAQAVLACLAGPGRSAAEAAASALAEFVQPRRGLERASQALIRWASDP
jgi:predicted protein tyrosine phosphatase